jgi:SSS family solute:Na+ symporter
MGVWPLHFTINVAVMTAVSALVLVAVSLAGPAPAPATVERAIWRPQLARPAEQRTAPWWADVRLHAVLVAIGMLAILIGFW